jgi:2Fe-2S ferredoxin
MVKIFVQALDGDQLIEATPGVSLMAALKANRIEGIEAACGGAQVCGTCHAYIADPHFGRLPAPNAIEIEMLEYAMHAQPNSRLTCQIIVTEELDGMRVAVPPSQSS